MGVINTKTDQITKENNMNIAEEIGNHVLAILKLANTQPKESTKPEYSFEQVRKYLAGLSKDGYTKQIKEIISSYGKDKLSEVDPKDYGSLMEAAGKLHG